MASNNRLQLILSADTKNANDSLKEFDRQVSDTMGAIQSKAQEASLALGGLAIAGAAMTKSFISEANQMQKYEATLKALTGSTEEARIELEKYLKFAADAPAFDLKGVMDGALKMKALKVDVERFLPLAGDLAAVFDRSLPDAALALAKALSGSQDGLTQLADAFGVTKKELIEFGAATKGDVIDVTQIEKLQDALYKVVSTKYGGVMMQQAEQANGAFATLEDAISRLKAAMGQEIIEGFAGAAKALTSVIEAAERLPGPTKAMIAQIVVAGTALAGLGAMAAGAVAAFAPMVAKVISFSAASKIAATATAAQTAATGVATAANFGFTASTVGAVTVLDVFQARLIATKAALMTFGGALAVVGVAAAGFAYYIHNMGEANELAEDALQKSEALADSFRKQKDTILDAAEALRAYGGDAIAAGKALADSMREAGKTEVDANEAIRGLLGQLQQARESGNAELEKRIEERIRALTRAREALAGTQAEKDAKAAKAAADEKAAIEAKGQAVEDYKKKASASYWETAKEELAALDSVMATIGKNHKDYEALSLSRIKLARQAAQEEVKSVEDARRKKLDEAYHEVDVLKQYGDKRLADQLAVLQRILDSESLSAEERKRIELEIISTKEKLANQAEQAAKKRAAEQEKLEKDKLKAQQDFGRLKDSVLQSEIRAADVSIQGLKEQLGQGKDVGAQLEQEIAARTELVLKLIQQQAETAKLGQSTAVQAQIEAKAQADLRAAKAAGDQEADRTAKDAAESRKKSALEALKLERQLLDARASADKKVTKQDLVDVARQRLAIAEQQLKLEAEISSASASDEEKKRIAIQLELDLWNTRRSSVEELAAATTELDKQRQKVEEMKKSTLGGIQSLDEFVADMNASFAADKKESKTEAPSAEEAKAGAALGVNPNAAPPQSSTDSLPQVPVNLRVEFVVPQGAPQDGWAFRSQQT